MFSNKTFLCGYYGMRNSGDDALLLASLEGAKRFMGATEFIVSSPVNIQLPESYSFCRTLQDTQRFKGENRLRHYHCASKSGSLIFGGGSVLHNSHDINIKRHLIKLTGYAGKSYALGVGIGPFTDKYAEKKCAFFLNDCTFVGVRDQKSYDIAQAIAPNANVKLTFDLAPLLLQHKSLEKVSRSKSGICICLCPKERLNGNPELESSRIKKLAKIFSILSRESKEDLIFLDFNGHPLFGDSVVHQEVISHLCSKIRYEHIHYNQNPLLVMQKLSTFKVIFGMRLHASILGFLMETPVISLNYHSKCEGWCDQIGIPKEYRIDLNVFDEKALLSSVLRGLEQGFLKPKLEPEDTLIKTLINWQ